MAAVLGLIIGVVIGVFVRPDIPIALQPYLPIMVLAALDALLGAARAYFQRMLYKVSVWLCCNRKVDYFSSMKIPVV